MYLAIATGLGALVVQGLLHRTLWNSSHLVTSPRFFVDTVGTAVVTILTVGVICLAFDSRVRDRNERIAEALDSHPLSNLALLTGRLVGIVVVVWLSAAGLALTIQAWGFLASLFQWPVGEGLEPVSLVMFLFFDALPTLSFWCALTLLLAAVLRFRLAVLAVGLSLFGTHVWVTAHVPLFLHDAVAANLAAASLPSEVAPVLPSGSDVLQRVAVISMAAGFLMLAAELYPRLDRGPTLTRILNGAGFVGIGVLLITGLVIRSFAEMDLRAAWLAAQEARRNEPRMDLESVSGVILIEPGQRLAIEVELALRNPHDRSMEHLVFSLNPGIEVEEARLDGTLATYRHELGILTVQPVEPLAPGGAIDLRIRASGVPDPRFAYLDSAIDNLAVPINESPVNTLGTAASIFRSDYVALMPGVRWLPSPGPNLSSDDPAERPRDFFWLDIDVEVPSGWLVAGPGRREAIADGRFRFLPAAVVDDVGLFASRFERRAIDAKGIEFELLVHPTHLKNVRLFAGVADALRTRIEAVLDRAERAGLEYPYTGLTLVEVPGRLRTHGGGWRMDSLEVLPAVVLLREVGFPVARLDAPLRSGDFRGSPGDPQVGVLERFFRGDAGGGDLRLNLARELLFAQTGARGEGAVALEFVCQDLAARLLTGAGGYFTPYLVTRGGFADMPQLLMIRGRGGGYTGIGYTLRKNARDSASTWQWARHTSLADLNAQTDPERAMHALALKGQAVGQALLAEMGEDTGGLLSALRYRFAGRTFTVADFEETAASVGTPLGALLGDWIHETSLPGFVASPLTIVRLNDDRRGAPRYQTRVHVHNGEPVGGLLRLRYMVREGTSATRIRNHWSSPIRVGPHASVEIGMVVPGPPQAGWVEPYLSLNQGEMALPQPDFDLWTQSPADPFNGTRASDWLPFPEGQIVVDDLDLGFVVATDSASATPRGVATPGLDRAVPAQDEGLPEYAMFAGVPQDWARLAVGSAWGRYRRTIAVTSTKGTASEAVFATELPSAGRWRVDYHLPFRGMRPVVTGWTNAEASRSREKAVRTGAPVLLTMPRGTYPIKLITSSYGIPVAFEASGGAEGWNPIGEIELDAPGEVRLVVSLGEINDAVTPVVIADAVRWLKLREH